MKTLICAAMLALATGCCNTPPQQGQPAEHGAEPVLPTTYVLKPGDTLAQIAQRYYGDAYQWTRIVEANRDTLASPNNMRVGQVLKIPAAAEDGR